MRRLIPTGLTALLVFALGACGATEGGHHTERRPEAGAQHQPAAPPPEVEQPGPQADPGQCVERPRRSVELQAHWQSETDKTPFVTWEHNGDKQPAANLRSHKEQRGYSGDWSILVTVECGDRLVVDMVGTPSMYAARCVIVDMAQDRVRHGERNCRATYVVP